MNNKLNKCRSIVIRDSKLNNSISYYCEFDTVQIKNPLVGYPDCYKDLYSRDGIWFKIIKMKPIENFEEISLSSKTLMGNSMESVLRSSASSVYFECTDDINL